MRQLASARPDLKRRGDETKVGSIKDDAPVRIIEGFINMTITQSTEPPWYVIRMPGGEASPYPD